MYFVQTFQHKLQALVYDILLPATAITDYAIGKNPKRQQQQQNKAKTKRHYQLMDSLFVDVQMAVSLIVIHRVPYEI